MEANMKVDSKMANLAVKESIILLILAKSMRENSKIISLMESV